MKKLPNLRENVEVLMLKPKQTIRGLSEKIGITEVALRGIFKRNDCKVSRAVSKVSGSSAFSMIASSCWAVRAL